MPSKLDLDGAAPAVLTRRALVAGMPLALAACAGGPNLGSMLDFGGDGMNYASVYGPKPNEEHPLPAMNYVSLDQTVLRRVVTDPTGEKPGTVVVDPKARRLYLVMEGGRAMRYGVGVGREGMEWSGRAKVGRKAAWPRWTPTADMIRRDPKTNGPWAGGMPGGLQNPLGARALYLTQGGRDTMYRIHGTNAPRTIGYAMSSGCIRMFNHDVIDLYERAPSGTPVVVLA